MCTVFIIVTILLILFSVGCVSATNTNTYVNVNGNNSWDGSTPTHTNATNGPKQTIATGLSVTNNGGNISIAAGTYKENNLIIAKNLTITGASKTNTIINAMGKNLIFFIKPGTIVTIKNLNITNGNATNADYNRNGGGIYNQGTLTIDNCIFYNNRAKDADDAGGAAGSDADTAGNGGAIYNTGTLTIKNSEFYNNNAGQGGDASATHNSSTGGSGGAIYNLGIIPNIQACTFRNNYAGRGGASSAFHDGKGGGSGGAIYNSGTINNIQTCTFTTNHAGSGGSTQNGAAANPGTGGNGGAIYSNNTVNINNSTFDGNYAGNGGEGSDIQDGAHGGYGGAIYNTGISTISGSEIKNGHAGTGGAGPGAAKDGADGNGGAIINMKTLTITSCNIHNNTANNGYGGGIYNNGLLTLQNSQINYNTAGNGGGIYNIGTIVPPVNTQIVNNTPDNYNNLNCVINQRTNQYYGKIQDAINNASSNDTLLIKPSTYQEDIIIITKNINLIGTGQTNTIIGGHIGIDTAYKVTITDLTITHGSSSSIIVILGGGIYNTGTLTLKNVTIQNCHADDKGGGIYNTGNLTIYDSTIISNNAKVPDKLLATEKGYGGGIYNSGVLTLYNTIVQSNTAKSSDQQVGEANGGGIYNTGTLNVYNSTFNSNTARNLADQVGGVVGYGGAIFSTGYLNVVNCSFNSNSANEGYGGAIYYKATNGLNIVNSTFNGNRAYGFSLDEYIFRTDYGGAIYCNSIGGLNVANSTFTNNAAWGGGGAIYNTGGGLTLKNSTFINNQAHYGIIKIDYMRAYGGTGGAIYNNNNLNITNCTFNNNIAMIGGSIYNGGSGNLTISNSNFTGNFVQATDKDGNPITYLTYDVGSPTEIITGIFTIASGITQMIFGFKQYWASSIVTFVSEIDQIVSNFQKNTIEAVGGAIYLTDSCNLNVKNCNFNNNTASLGGAIDNFSTGNLTVTDSTFNYNKAGFGGAIYNNNFGPLTVTGSIFNNNNGGSGGAIFYGGTNDHAWADLTVKENIFSGNWGYLGGVAYLGIQGVSHSIINFNRIYDPLGNYTLYNEYSSNMIDGKYNWWGSNDGPGTYNTNSKTNIDTSPFMILTVTADPSTIYYGSNSIIKADLLHDSRYDPNNPEASRHDPTLGLVPDGTIITFKTNDGSIIPISSTIVNGQANATYIADGTGAPKQVTVFANVDNTLDHVATYINIQQIPTKTFLNPVSNFAGQSVTLVAKITDNKDKLIDGGNVTFNIGIAPTVTVPVVNGYAEYYLTIPLGTSPLPYTISANYTGTTKYTSSAASQYLIVTPASQGYTGITVYPPINGTQGQTVNLIARLTDVYNNLPLANKNVAFSINGNNVGSAITDSNGVANKSYTILLAPGSYTITASFAADSPYSGSSNTGMLNVMPSLTGVSDLTITKKVQSIVRLGKNFVVTIKIGNKGPDIAKDVVIKFSIPKGIDFITASVDQGTWNYNKATRLFTWNLGDVAVGDPYLNLTLKANKLGQYQLKHLLTTKTYDPTLENQMIPLSIVITTPGDNNGDNGNGSSVNVEGKTIGMQKTGTPITCLIIAILALIGGLASSKRK